MESQNGILVGVDGSQASLSAVEWAIARASRSGQNVHIVCVYSTVAYTTYGFESAVTTIDPEALENGARAVVESALTHIRSLPQAAGVTITSEVIGGDPASVLVELSETVDMIVIGTEAHGRIFSRIFGTVSSTVPAYSKCPVVVVPAFEGGGKTFTPVERLVVGVEASERVSKALRVAVTEAQVWDGKLTVVSAVPIPGMSGIMTWIPNAGDHDALMREMRHNLDTAVDSAIEGTGLRVKRHAIDGAPAQLLVEFSTAVDLVIVGSRGYSALTQAVLGVTSQAVLAHAECPVMVVPHHDNNRETVTYGWSRR